MKIIVSLIILIVLLIFNKNIEKFYDLDDCVFEPWGPNLNACIQTCRSVSKNKKPWNTSNNNSINCDYDNCASICNSCSDNNRCEWLGLFESSNNVSNNSNINSSSNDLIPRPIELNITGDNLIWEHKDDNDNIMIHYLKENKDSSKVNIIHLDKTSYIKFMESEQLIDPQLTSKVKKQYSKKIIRYPIQNLEPNDKYTFFIYIINEYGVSNISNKVEWPN
jgi:hypothetical protein